MRIGLALMLGKVSDPNLVQGYVYKGQEVSSCRALRVELWRNASLHSNFIPMPGLLWKE